jgi:hypothetical protein
MSLLSLPWALQVKMDNDPQRLRRRINPPWDFK